MTTVADALYQWGGVPVGVNPIFNKIMSQPRQSYAKGRAWFVDPSSSRVGNGKSPNFPFATMEEAFDALHSGDIIYAAGNIREQLVTPAQVFDVTVIGCGNRPRNADSTPEGGQYAACTWRAPASGGVAAQATVRVIQQGWLFYNILFNMIDANAAGVELVRNAAAGNSERDASHASLIGCRWAGAGVGVRSGVAGLFTEIVFNVEVAGGKFNGCTTAMSGAAGFGGNSWDIHDNDFHTNTSQIIMALSDSHIYRNRIGRFTAAANSGGIDTRGGGGTNSITGNFLSGAYSKAGGYNTEAGDEWWGNFADLAGGVTQADPA